MKSSLVGSDFAGATGAGAENRPVPGSEAAAACLDLLVAKSYDSCFRQCMVGLDVRCVRTWRRNGLMPPRLARAAAALAGAFVRAAATAVP